MLRKVPQYFNNQCSPCIVEPSLSDVVNVEDNENDPEIDQTSKPGKLSICANKPAAATKPT